MLAQGDILFIKRDCVIKDGYEKDDGVIALGESTGHIHRIRPGQDAALRLIAGVMYVEAIKECIIEHVNQSGFSTGDHSEIVLPAGNWEIRRQREYTPDGFRQVSD